MSVKKIHISSLSKELQAKIREELSSPVDTKSIKSVYRFVQPFKITPEDTIDSVLARIYEAFAHGHLLAVTMVSFPSSINHLSSILPSSGNSVLYISACFDKAEKCEKEKDVIWLQSSEADGNCLPLKLDGFKILQEVAPL